MKSTSFYKALIDGEKEIEISREDLRSLDIVQVGSEGMHVIRDNHGYRVRVLSADYAKKEFLLHIGHQEVKVRLKDALELQVESMGFERNNSKHINEILAPMPGLVLDIRVTVGDAVEIDDPLIILEAMKMENVLAAPRKGTIAEVSVNKGDTVDKAQKLIRFE